MYQFLSEITRRHINGHKTGIEYKNGRNIF